MEKKGYELIIENNEKSHFNMHFHMLKHETWYSPI